MTFTAGDISDLNNSMEAARNFGSGLGTELNWISGSLATAIAELAEGDVGDVSASLAAVEAIAAENSASIVALDAIVTENSASIVALPAVASGSLSPASAEEAVSTGLSTVSAVVVSLSGSPTLEHAWVSAVSGSTAGDIIISCWKVTGSEVVTPIAATGSFVDVNWVAVGT